ncbi:MAG TPA: UbiA family prenyltransferase [Candidatus Lokiarchaeia archaeon]|nr:UbiA family prenyltransferase [Candidatus Lokiarchaeia archaeon]
MNTKFLKIIGWVRATRPQFLVGYIGAGVIGLLIGFSQFKALPSIPFAVLDFVIVILSAIGVAFRDEAADWIAGYDLESGGVGVIREGIIDARPLQRVGRTLNIIAGGLAVYHFLLVHQLVYIGIPSAIFMIGTNYITERITLGHEIVAAFSFPAAFLLLYIGQGSWQLNLGTLLFAVFLFLLAFGLVPYQDIGDYEIDKKTGKKTLTVKLGIDRVGLFSITIVMVSTFVLTIAIWAFLNP